MTRTSRNITLGLVGSALMATCCITSGCLDTDEEREQRLAEQKTTGSTVRRHSYHSWPRYYWWSTPRYSYSSPGIAPAIGHGTPGTSSSGGTQSSSSSSAGRGGFGSTGHSVAGG
jgi:hypothetical protein